MNKHNGLLVVLSSPSGGGKTTVIKKILETHSEYCYSISTTTREIRPGEVNGRDYYFVSEKEFFDIEKAGGFVEWENVHGNFYGTPIAALKQRLAENKVVFLDLDVNGALELKKRFREDALLIFLMPPDEKKLVERLKGRATESDEQINKRLERIPLELDKAKYFDEIVINDNLNETIDNVVNLVMKKRLSAKLLEEN